MKKDAIIYLRVSTKDQTPEQQLEPCIHRCKEKNWTYDVVTEIQSSVKYRQVFQQVLKVAQKKPHDK